MDFKHLLSLAAIAIAVISYIPYFRNIFAGKTKPHAFTWLVWSILNGIAFAGQLQGKAGPGAWPVGFTAVALLAIFILALIKGERNIKPFDWYCLVAALLGLVPWALTNNPLASVIIITVIDAVGFMPTVRKSYYKPHQETAVTFVMSVVKYLLAVLALQQYTAVTVLFPLAMVIMNALFVALLVVRRRQLPAPDAP